MSRSALAQSVAILSEDDDAESSSTVDLAVSLRVCTVERTVAGDPRYVLSTDEELIEVGGRWDRRGKRWSDAPSETLKVIRVPRGSDQEVAARWLAEWLRRYAQGPRGDHWDAPTWGDERARGVVRDFRRVWTLLLEGGRRGGKSYLACVALVMFAVMEPKAITWAVSPTQDETDELEQAVRALLPRGWYTFRGGGAGKPLQFRFANGSRILCLSGHKPRALKRGRVDLAVYNEAQNMYGAGWRQLRGAVADRGGLVICTCNPPDSEIGRWIEDVHERAIAGKIKAQVFKMTASTNPFVEVRALEDMADETDELTYRREVLGEFVPIGDTAMHAWSDTETVRDVPAGFVDVTAEVTRRTLGRAFGAVIGMDFQATPHMAAAVLRWYRDPADVDAEPIAWIVDEVVVADADENELLDQLEAKGYRGWTLDDDLPQRPEVCAVVYDASGAWQDGAHSKGKTSEMALRARRWTWLYKPQKDSDRNPEIVERVKIANARLKSQSGRRRLFSARANLHVNRAMRSWENRGGVPFRRSAFAHVCDAVTYPIFRFCGRPKIKGDGGGYEGKRRFGRKEEMAAV